jgi:hypothetical protein
MIGARDVFPTQQHPKPRDAERDAKIVRRQVHDCVVGHAHERTPVELLLKLRERVRRDGLVQQAGLAKLVECRHVVIHTPRLVHIAKGHIGDLAIALKI